LKTSGAEGEPTAGYIEKGKDIYKFLYSLDVHKSVVISPPMLIDGYGLHGNPYVDFIQAADATYGFGTDWGSEQEVLTPEGVQPVSDDSPTIQIQTHLDPDSPASGILGGRSAIGKNKTGRPRGRPVASSNLQAPSSADFF
jgi:hypothetical protein